MLSIPIRLGQWLPVLLLLLAVGSHAQDRSAPAGDEIPVREIQVAAEAFVRGAALPAWVEPIAPPLTKRTNPYVIRLWDTQFRVDRRASVYVNRAIQINDVSLLTEMGQTNIDFVPQYQKLSLHKVQVLRGKDVLDQTRSVRVRFLQRELGLENGVYSGAVSASLLISDLRVGDTLQVSYTIEGANPVFEDRYSEFAGVDVDAPVELRSVILSHPVSRDIQWRILGEKERGSLQPKITEAAGWRKLRFTLQPNEGIDYEPGIPGDYIAYRQLQFSEFKNWNEVARWAVGLFPRLEKTPPELQPLIAQWRTLPTPEQRAVAALRWVQKEIRYFSVSMGESSHRPHPPGEVLQHRFGDCKDKAYLLMTLLRQLDMDASPLLLSASRPKLPAKMAPTPLAFDHVIVQLRLDGKNFYLDPTLLGQAGGLDTMGVRYDGAASLVVAPETVALTNIEWPGKLDLNTVELNETMSLASFGGAAVMDVTWTWRGLDAEAMRNVFPRLNPEQTKKYALGQYERRYPGIDLTQAPVFQDDASNNRVYFKARYTIPKAASEYERSWFIKFVPGNFIDSFSLPKNFRRQFPAVFTRAPYRAKYKLVINWPDSVAVLRDPVNRRVRNQFFELEQQRSFRGNVSTFEASLTMLTEQAVPDDLPKLSKEIDQLNGVIPRVEYVDANAIKKSGVLGFGGTTLQDNIKKRLQQTITQLSRTIQGGVLKGDDLAEALCARAEALADIGTPEKGMEDAGEAVRIAPSLARAWECRGHLYLDNASFEKSIPDFTKALTLGTDEANVFQRRGIARFYLGMYNEAEADFAKAVEAAGRKDDVNLYPVLWQAWTQLRLGRPLSAEVLRQAGNKNALNWPHAALALLASRMTPDQVLEEVRRKQGDDREMALAEAWFYIGQYYVVKGDTAQARAAFEKTRAQGVTVFTEHAAALWELERLNKASQQK
jgi:lipoprotein NlpI